VPTTLVKSGDVQTDYGDINPVVEPDLKTGRKKNIPYPTEFGIKCLWSFSKIFGL
jgi:hypothetical protein